MQINKLNLVNRKAKRNTNKIGKNDGKITKLTRFVWQPRRLKHNDNRIKKTTMKEVNIQNNRNNRKLFEIHLITKISEITRRFEVILTSFSSA